MACAPMLRPIPDLTRQARTILPELTADSAPTRDELELLARIDHRPNASFDHPLPA